MNATGAATTLQWAGVIQLITARPLLLCALVLASAACLVLLLAFSLARRKQRRARAALSLVGRTGTVERALDPEGFVLIDGELWPARLRAGAHVSRNTRGVRVVGARGHLLEVEEAAEIVARDVLSLASASTDEVKP